MSNIERWQVDETNCQATPNNECGMQSKYNFFRSKNTGESMELNTQLNSRDNISIKHPRQMMSNADVRNHHEKSSFFPDKKEFNIQNT